MVRPHLGNAFSPGVSVISDESISVPDGLSRVLTKTTAGRSGAAPETETTAAARKVARIPWKRI
jgi:hypothetical protein